MTVVAAAAADEVDLVRTFGAAHVLDRDGDFVDGVLAFTDGRGVDALADPAILTDRVVGAVRDGGQIAFFLPNDSHPGRGIAVFRSYVMHSTARHDLITKLVELSALGAITTGSQASSQRQKLRWPMLCSNKEALGGASSSRSDRSLSIGPFHPIIGANAQMACTAVSWEQGRHRVSILVADIGGWSSENQSAMWSRTGSPTTSRRRSAQDLGLAHQAR